MEETLGKRISFHRKRLGLTQDALAEKMGVTAQAVSKWENDLSCPDITILPKLAQVFGVSTDALLGVEPPEAPPAVVIAAPEPPREEEEKGGTWELTYNNSRSKFGMASWVLLVGILQLLVALNGWSFISFFSILWSSGLLVFGLYGLYPRFSFFRLGCTLFGGYYLLNLFDCLPFPLSLASKKQLLFPILLLLLGLSLLFDAWKKRHNRKDAGFTIRHNGRAIASKSNHYEVSQDGFFNCANSFSENTYRVDLPLLAGGKAESSFGEMVVDLTGCKAVAEGCQVEVNNSFGELEILIPRRFQADLFQESTLGSIDTVGHPSEAPEGTLRLICSSSFGEITIRYI